MLDGVVAEKKIETKSNSDLDDRKSLPSAEKGEIPDNETWETQLFQVYKGSASLKYPHIKPGDATEQFILEPALLPLQEGVGVIPDTAQVSAYSTGKKEGVIFTALGGRVELAIPNLEQAKGEAQLATMNMISEQISGLANKQQTEMMTDQTSLQMDDTEICVYLRDTVVIEPIEGIRIELGQGEYIKREYDQNPKLRFRKTRLVFTAQDTATDCQTELDETGLHTLEEVKVQLDDQKKENISAALVLEKLNARRKPEALEPIEEKDVIEEQPEEEQPQVVQAQAEQPKEKRPQAVQTQEEPAAEEWKEFKPGDLTKDGFVKMEEAEYKIEKVSDTLTDQYGKAKFRFMEIPYTIPLFNKEELKGKTKTKEPDQEMHYFYVGSSGKLHVDFDEPIELSLIGNEKIEQYLVATIRLEGASIENSLLTAKKIRIDLGVAPRPDEEEKGAENQSEEESEDKGILKKLFGENISGTFAYISDVNNINKEGIHAAPGKKSLGAFGVSKFLGFLDVEGDYPTGQLKVGFEDQKEKGMSDIFDDKTPDIFGDGINIPIVAPLAFKISISPSVSMGGALTANLDRKKSFGEPMEPGESMDLSGEAKINGEGKLEMAAGLALTLSGILSSVSLDFKVGSELSAGIEVTAQADTALGLSDEKLKQTEDLNVDGGVEIDLQGKVNLSSDIRFFVWNARLFEVDLYNKEVHIQPYQGHASRDKNASGLTKGWHFESMGLSAKGLGEKAAEAMRNSKDFRQARERKLEMSKEAAESLGKEVESSWTLLEELNRRNALSKECVYLTTDEEKKALDERIKEVAKDVREKITQYKNALENYQYQLYKEKNESEHRIDEAREERFQCLEQDAIRRTAMKNTQRGGFQLDKYRPLTQEESKNMSKNEIKKENESRNQMAAIDFTIARALGIYDNALDEQRNSYEMLAREQNLKRQVDKRQGKESSEEEFIYPMLNEIRESNFLYGITVGDKYKWGGAIATLRYQTQFGRDKYEEEHGHNVNNYFDVLHNKSVSLKDIPWYYGRSKYAPIFQRKTAQGEVVEIDAMRSYDFAKVLFSGVYPEGACDEKGNSVEGQPIEKLDADRKLALYKEMFKSTLSKEEKTDNLIGRFLWGKEYKAETTQQEKMVADINKVLGPLFGSNLDSMVAKGDIDMNEKLRQLDDKLEATKVDYLKAVEKHYEIENAIKKVKDEREDCAWKFNRLRGIAGKGMKLSSESVEAAKAAVNFMKNDYVDVANGVTLVKDAVTGIGEKSDVYEKMEEIEKQVFPERKNAAEALKTPVVQQ